MGRATLKFSITDKGTHAELLDAAANKLAKYLQVTKEDVLTSGDYSLDVYEDPKGSGNYTAEVYVRIKNV